MFAGTRSVSKAFERRGIETHSIELDTIHPDIDWYADISQITAQDIVDRFGIPDAFCDHIAEICINETKGIKPMPKYHQSKLDVI